MHSKLAVLLSTFLVLLWAGAAQDSCGELVLVRIRYTVDTTDARQHNDWNAKGFASVLHNVSLVLNSATSVRAAPEPKVLKLEDEEIFGYPFLFMAGHHGVKLNDQEVARLHEHLEKGGFLLATACCGNSGFVRCFKREMKKVFPERELQTLPPEHPIYRTLYQIDQVTCHYGRDQTSQSKDPTPLQGIEIDGRLVVVFSPKALTCGWTRKSSCITGCRRIATEDAFHLAANVVVYSLTH